MRVKEPIVYVLTALAAIIFGYMFLTYLNFEAGFIGMYVLSSLVYIIFFYNPFSLTYRLKQGGFSAGSYILDVMFVRGMLVYGAAFFRNCSAYSVIHDQDYMYLSTIIAFIICSLIIVIYSKYSDDKNIEVMMYSEKYLSLLFYMESMILVCLLFLSAITHFSDIHVSLIIIIIFMYIVVYTSYYLLLNFVTSVGVKDSERLDYLSDQLQKQLDNYNAQAEYITGLRRIKHDYKNQLLGLKHLIDDNDVESAKVFMEDMNIKFNESLGNYHQYSNNPLLDAILNDANKRAIRGGVKFEALIPPLDELPISDFDLCNIFSNLLNNAFEACEKLKDHRFIKVDGSIKNGWINIRISNSFDGYIKREKGEIVSSKKDTKLHGIGLKSIRQTILENDGIMKVITDEEKKVFVVFISMYKNQGHPKNENTY